MRYYADKKIVIWSPHNNRYRRVALPGYFLIRIREEFQ